MNIWLCPVKPKSWKTINRTKVFGVPGSSLKIFSKVKPDDILIIHVLRPVAGIVAMAKVISDIYEDNSDIWGKDRYPHRVKIEFLPDQLRSTNNPIPLDILLGNNPNSDFSISPFLKNVFIAPVSAKQYENIKKAFSQGTTKYMFS